MIRTPSPVRAMLSLAAIAVLAVGCSTSEPGVTNSMGTLTTTVEADPPRATQAAEAVLKELQLIRVESKFTGVDGKAVGHTASDKKVTVNIARETDELSSLKVRVGAFGDEDLGLAVISRIEDQLAPPKDK